MVQPSARKMCYDRILPQDLIKRRNLEVLRTPEGRVRAVAPLRKQWVNGSTLRIRFLGGTPDQQQMVREIAPEWTRYANLNFEFTDDPRAEIRISFDEHDGAWSYVGTDNSDLPLHAATLNLGWVDRAIILHEFGHMIGLGHEHQNPAGGIVWNEDVVMRDLSGPPSFWEPATIRHNVLDKYAADQLNGREFDPDSIMLYAFPDDWAENAGRRQLNSELSPLDRAFVQSATLYPGRETRAADAVELPVINGATSSIAQPGEEDLYVFQVKQAGTFLIETNSDSDLFMTLFGPNSMTQKLAEDDDNGSDDNPRITAVLQPGQYYARVRHYDARDTSDYEIRVVALD
ncbi:MAG: M12 family metallopeptidase [Polyangiales bacterium]